MSKLLLRLAAGVFVGTVIALAGSGAAHAYTAAQLSTLLPNAKTTIVAEETQCTNDLKALLPGKTRTDVNTSRPYKLNNWISPLGAPSQTSVTVPYGTTSVPLQLNQLEFICSILVQNSEPAEISPTYTWDLSAIVNNLTYPRERLPVLGDGASLYETNTRVNAASVTSGIGTIGASPVGKTFRLNRNNTTRYWFTNTEPTFSYAYAPGLTTTQTVTIKFNLTTIRSYHPLATRQLKCNGPTPDPPDDFSLSSFASCGSVDVLFSIKINVLPPPAVITPLLTSAAGPTGSTIEPGKTYIFNPGAHNTSAFSSLKYKVNFTGDANGLAYSTPVAPYGFPYTTPVWQAALLPIQTVFLANHSITIKPLTPEGTPMCFMATITPTSPDTAPGQASLCYIVHRSYTPGITGLGSDIHAGGKFCGSLTSPGAGIITNGLGLSFGQYVVSAKGSNPTSFGSNGVTGSKAANLGSAGNYLEVCRPDLMTVATAYQIANPGGFSTLSGGSHTLQDFYNADILNHGIVYVAGDVTITGGPINYVAGLIKTLTIVSSGTVTITGDILPNGGSYPAKSLPSLGIIADAINISGSAQTVSAYMFAQNNINTCSSGPCDNTLKVNGFLMANSLSLTRMGPLGGLATQTSGEQITLTPQLYINPPILFNNAGTINLTQSQGERPPLQ